jgi:hypothetical protein
MKVLELRISVEEERQHNLAQEPRRSCYEDLMFMKGFTDTGQQLLSRRISLARMQQAKPARALKRTLQECVCYGPWPPVSGRHSLAAHRSGYDPEMVSAP